MSRRLAPFTRHFKWLPSTCRFPRKNPATDHVPFLLRHAVMLWREGETGMDFLRSTCPESSRAACYATLVGSLGRNS